AEAFKEYGIDVDVLAPAEAARRIGAANVKRQLLTALEHWAVWAGMAKDPRRDGLLQLARLADDDPWRDQLHAAILERQGDRLEKMARQPQASEQPPTSVYFLAVQLRSRGQHRLAVEVLRPVQRRHPADFWVNLELAMNLLIDEKREQPAQAEACLRV